MWNDLRDQAYQNSGMQNPSMARSARRGPASMDEGDRPPMGPRIWERARVGDSGFDRRRTRENDFQEQANDGALWSSQGQANFLFSKNNSLGVGKYFVVGVEEGLKQAISFELERSMPPADRSMRSIAAENEKDGQSQGEPGNNAQNNPDANTDKKEQFIDRIPVVVADEMGDDVLKIKGQKDIRFMGRKRRVEVLGLIRKTDIAGDDTIQSSKLLDRRIRILR
jgi:flagellar basal body L-ring protein FlgH